MLSAILFLGRYDIKPVKPRVIIAHVEGSGRHPMGRSQVS
jgi:hypothetical protein